MNTNEFGVGVSIDERVMQRYGFDPALGAVGEQVAELFGDPLYTQGVAYRFAAMATSCRSTYDSQ